MCAPFWKGSIRRTGPDPPELRTYQRDTVSSPEELVALNLILHIRFRPRSDSERSDAAGRTGKNAGADKLEADP